ncbi:MAG: polysaccharide deacetylase family protein [Alphaproteobacteria bacterium]|nr:polysaccharide deacetylase family protein [Alphaproteobacteria bacterium]MCZ6813548.1 polysaccharide deacetylase family protein [Alphaproteobacteria bacterium]
MSSTGPGFKARPVAHASTIVALGLALVTSPGPGAAQQTARERPREPASAVVMMYHRFGEHAWPSTNIRIDQFEAHLEELATGKYAVRPVADIIGALKAGRPLPDRTIGLSIDDAFLSVYRQAWPRLRKAGLSFTLFIATGAVDRGGKDYMNWDQIREMARAGVTIGAHSVSHAHLPMLSAGAIKGELAKSNQRFEKELGFKPRLFAYPYGEASRVVMAAARAAGYMASFGQHSGVAHGKSDFFYLPRFTMNERYGALARFRLAANALPLHATDITPRDPTLGPNPPAFGFTVGKGIRGLRSLACYSSVHGKLALQHLGQRRIEVRPPRALKPGRTRINCTLPAGGGRWRWLSYQFFVIKK